MHRGARQGGIARGDGIADRNVLFVSEFPKARIFRVARELLEIWIDAQVEQLADEAHEHGVVQRLGYGRVEATIKNEIGVPRALPAPALCQNAVEPRHVGTCDPAGRFFGNSTLHESACT